MIPTPQDAFQFWFFVQRVELGRVHVNECAGVETGDRVNASVAEMPNPEKALVYSGMSEQ